MRSVQQVGDGDTKVPTGEGNKGDKQIVTFILAIKKVKVCIMDAKTIQGAV